MNSIDLAPLEKELNNIASLIALAQSQKTQDTVGMELMEFADFIGITPSSVHIVPTLNGWGDSRRPVIRVEAPCHSMLPYSLVLALGPGWDCNVSGGDIMTRTICVETCVGQYIASVRASIPADDQQTLWDIGKLKLNHYTTSTC